MQTEKLSCNASEHHHQHHGQMGWDDIRQQVTDLQRQVAGLNTKITRGGLMVTLGDVLFEKNKIQLKRGAASQLRKLSALLEQYPDSVVEIKGYTDNSGSKVFNLELSTYRACSIRLYLINEGGIAPGRLSASGYGEDFPVAGNGSASGRQLNHRVEVMVTGISIPEIQRLSSGTT